MRARFGAQREPNAQMRAVTATKGDDSVNSEGACAARVNSAVLADQHRLGGQPSLHNQLSQRRCQQVPPLQSDAQLQGVAQGQAYQQMNYPQQVLRMPAAFVTPASALQPQHQLVQPLPQYTNQQAQLPPVAQGVRQPLQRNRQSHHDPDLSEDHFLRVRHCAGFHT